MTARGDAGRNLLLLAVLVGTGACATTRQSELVVLVPAPDGHVGSVDVTVDDQTTRLDRANQGLSIGTGPTAPVLLTDDDMRREFGAALDALPLPPRRFTLYFDEGTEQLVAESQAQLPEILADIQAREASEIGVIGHTDRVAAEDYNAALSERRAASVRDWLVRNGVRADAVTIAGRGELDPIIATDDGVAEARNRRVEVTIR